MYRRTTTPYLLSFLTRFVLVFVQHGVSTNVTRASPAELNYFKAGPVHGKFAGESLIVEQQKEGPQKEQHSTSSTSQTPSAPRHPEVFYMLAPRHPETFYICLLYTSPSPRDKRQSRMPSSA